MEDELPTYLILHLSDEVTQLSSFGIFEKNQLQEFITSYRKDLSDALKKEYGDQFIKLDHKVEFSEHKPLLKGVISLTAEFKNQENNIESKIKIIECVLNTFQPGVN